MTDEKFVLNFCRKK